MTRALAILLLLSIGAMGYLLWSAEASDNRAEAYERRASDAELDAASIRMTLAEERGINESLRRAANAADSREEQINADYDRRIAAADAGHESELGQLRKLWGSCETGRLSSGAVAASEAAEQDRLRRASAARIVRAVELAQSERDEAIDRYEAVVNADRAALGDEGR